MRIITVDNKVYEVKYLQNREDITNEIGTSSFNHPNFIGSKLYQNSSSSDIYNITFAIHKNQFIGLKESLKKFVVNEDDALDNADYGKLTNIVLEHNIWGAIKGKIVGSIKYDTSKDGDIICSCQFQENTEDTPIEKTDIEQENQDATDEVNSETDEEFELDEEDKPALLRLAEGLQELYNDIQNSAVIAAFNDLQSALNEAILNYQKVMNAVKKILSLPGSIISGVRGKMDFFKKQAIVIRNIPVSTFNMARFNMNILAFNLSRGSRTPFISKAAARAASGVKVAPVK